MNEQEIQAPGDSYEPCPSCDGDGCDYCWYGGSMTEDEAADLRREFRQEAQADR